MTTTWGQNYLYGSISRILLTTTRSYAVCPLLKSVLVASRSASGGMTFSGQSSTMAFQPLEIAEDGTHFYAIGTTGVEKHTMAAVPAFANLFSLDAGLGKFIFSQGSYLVVPDGDSGVQTISRTTGLVQDSLPGVLGKIHAGCYDSANRRLWLFDQDRAKGVSIQVGTAGQLTYTATFPIPNCRDIVRVVFDAAASLLFVINDHRIVSFSTADWEAPELSVDYGVNTGTFTDFAKIGTNQYWIGMAEPSNADAVPGPFGPQYGAWDSVNAEMQIACPKMSLWTVSNAIPYWSVTTIPEIIITPPTPPVVPPYVPPVIVPPPPVITSGLTASVIEDTLFSYTITATGTGPIAYGVVSPPTWLVSVNAITGAISGTPPDIGTFNITITATNAGGTDTEILVVTVTDIYAGADGWKGAAAGVLWYSNSSGHWQDPELAYKYTHPAGPDKIFRFTLVPEAGGGTSIGMKAVGPVTLIAGGYSTTLVTQVTISTPGTYLIFPYLDLDLGSSNTRTSLGTPTITPTIVGDAAFPTSSTPRRGEIRKRTTTYGGASPFVSVPFGAIVAAHRMPPGNADTYYTRLPSGSGGQTYTCTSSGNPPTATGALSPGQFEAGYVYYPSPNIVYAVDVLLSKT